MRFGCFFNFSEQARIKGLLMKWVSGYHLLRKLWLGPVGMMCIHSLICSVKMPLCKEKQFWSSGSVKWRLKSRFLRDLRVRRGWCENVDSPGSVCGSHEIQKELVFPALLNSSKSPAGEEKIRVP